MVKPLKPTDKIRVSVDFIEEEHILLAAYCQEKGRSMTEIIRELVRNLKLKK